ncbi:MULTISPECIES: hypothetical protein [unclassified Luteimonas]|uniref:hypothetical protein n=1 Tax=unclassified Luteimonas TaxID=2629088 RepID=UPI0016036E93|nr:MULTISPECIES: hypothetical protein [unclassified Luteimonas]MBB1471960.1 hypothetical protein [Luteimonas sp. MC1782]MBB6599311.1 hypothetical protein [Luteimonas sp. MC1825]QOC87025.1 hypothetical protein IDM46_06875 [Luteimonas sp. MC1825]
MTLTLQVPWSELLRTKNEKRRYPAVLGYVDGAGSEHRIEATVETRGLTRLRICRFPPLMIRFARHAALGTDFAGQRTLKLVTHCRPGAVAEQYYVQELLAYRIFNHVTEHSFRVRPLRITYEDASGGESHGTRFAFLIEDLDAVAKRNGYRRSPRAQFAQGDFDPLALTRFMLFQYLIGNTDWEVLSGPEKDACCHNVRILVPADAPGPMVAVPYDFDASGLVDASYAVPNERLPIRSVTQRLYRGFCLHNDALGPVRREFLAKRDAIFALVRSEDRLSGDRKQATIDYFEAFFATLDSDARFAREISGRCRR